MKYIKQFESINAIEDIKLSISDILLDLRDDGLNANVYYADNGNDKNSLYVKFIDYLGVQSEFDMIKGYIFRINKLVKGRMFPSIVKYVRPDTCIYFKNNIETETYEIFMEKAYKNNPKLAFFCIRYTSLR